MENYLIDLDVITELLKDETITRSPISDEGAVHTLLRDLAFRQLDGLAAREVYNSFKFANPSLRGEDVDRKSLSEIASSLFHRMNSARASIPEHDEDAWKAEFIRRCQTKRSELEQKWVGKFKELCDGKALISALHKEADLKMSESAFKSKIIQKMKDTNSENWLLVKGILETLLAS